MCGTRSSWSERSSGGVTRSGYDEYGCACVTSSPPTPRCAARWSALPHGMSTTTCMSVARQSRKVTLHIFTIRIALNITSVHSMTGRLLLIQNTIEFLSPYIIFYFRLRIQSGIIKGVEMRAFGDPREAIAEDGVCRAFADRPQYARKQRILFSWRR